MTNLKSLYFAAHGQMKRGRNEVRPVEHRADGDDGAAVGGQHAHVNLAVLCKAIMGRPELDCVMRLRRIKSEPRQVDRSALRTA